MIVNINSISYFFIAVIFMEDRCYFLALTITVIALLVSILVKITNIDLFVQTQNTTTSNFSIISLIG